MRHVKDGCVCAICDHYMETGRSCRCMVGNNNFNYARYPEDCDDFEYCEFDDDDDSDDDFDPTDVEYCPICDSEAYWNGSEYECSNDDCGWCGQLD